MEILTLDIPLWSIILVALFVTYLLYMTKEFRCFKRMGVKGPMPLPVFGNMITSGRLGTMKADETWMEKYGKVFGIFEGKTPNLIVADEEMLSQLFVKKFSHFTDRSSVDGFEGDLEHGLPILKGDHWKNVRNMMTPTFSAGKLRKMTGLVKKSTELLVENINKDLEENKEINMKMMYGAYTTDVISLTAFGIEANSQREPNSKFVKNVAKIFDFTLSSPFVLLFFFAPFVLKPLNKLFGVSFIPKSAQQFFREVVVKEINNRKSKREDYVDFMQMMIEAHTENSEETKRSMSFKEILGNSLVFFFAGYETTATTLSLFSHNMALHPEIQEKVHDEILQEIGDEEPDYDNVQKLVYLEMCINETLRLYPPATRTERICTANTDLNGVPIAKGMMVSVPIWAIQRCADNWANPETFNPERFSPENKRKQSPFHFLPFGYGPRNCIGMRLAFLELKVALVYVIRQFKFFVGEKTQIPPKLSHEGLISPKEVWLKVEKR